MLHYFIYIYICLCMYMCVYILDTNHQFVIHIASIFLAYLLYSNHYGFALCFFCLFGFFVVFFFLVALSWPPFLDHKHYILKFKIVVSFLTFSSLIHLKFILRNGMKDLNLLLPNDYHLFQHHLLNGESLIGNIYIIFYYNNY